MTVNAREEQQQLFYLNRAKVDERNNEPSIAFVRVIGYDKTLPIEPKDPFSYLFHQYSSLGDDEELRSYIVNHPPDRYKNPKPDLLCQRYTSSAMRAFYRTHSRP